VAVFRPDRGPASENGLPTHAAQMKQLSNYISLGIEPGEICSFVKIAIGTGKGEIFDIVTAAVNFRNDVFNVECGERRIILMQMTVFASVLSTLANLSPDLCTDHL
jgi:hypothetical protein